MKRLTVLLLAGVLTFGCVACGNTNSGAGNNKPNTESNSQQETPKVEIKDATELLTKVWDEYNAKASEDLQLFVGGGNPETMVENNAGKFDSKIEGAMDMLAFTFCASEDTVAKTDDISTLMSMMNSNQLSAAAYHVTNAADVETVINSIKDATLGNQWMCGFPETLIIATVGDDYVVSAFGNEQLIDTFEDSLESVYGDMVDVVVEEDLSR